MARPSPPPEAQKAARASPLPALRQRVLQQALALADSLDEAIAEAPLNQRASALGVLIDRLIKLERELPESEEQKRVIRIEYQYPDGTRHTAAPWSARNPERAGALHGRRVRAALRQDRTGQEPDA